MFEEAITIYAAIAVVLVVFWVLANREKDEKGKVIRRQLALVVLIDLVCMIVWFLKNPTAEYIVNSLIQIMADWILYYFLVFACMYANSELLADKNKRQPLIFVLCVDNFFILLTKLMPQWFIIHMIICLIPAAILVAMMFHKALRIPRVYRLRYLAISGIFAVSSVAYAYFSFARRGYMNFSLVCFLAVGISIYFLTYYYAPRLRSRKMKNFVINNMANPVVMFDFDDVIQVYNQAAVEILNVQPGMKLSEFVKDSNLKYILTEERRRQGKTKEFTIALQIGSRYYLVTGQERWDQKNRFIGVFLIYNDISDQENMKNEATWLATHDALTGMWNRDYFFEAVNKEIRENPDVEFLMIASDIYQFKIFNDVLGKKVGDELLCAFAKGFQEKARPLWELARISGDRFALLIPKRDFEEKRFLDFCHQLQMRKEYTLNIHNYFGIYHITDRSLRAEQMYDRAYMVVESIKGSMTKEIAYYDEELRKNRIDATLNADELELAMRENQFMIYLQPQIDPVNGKVVGSEALVRWKSPKRGMVSPGEFIPLFEQNDMIAELDYLVWELACKQLNKWKKEGKGDRSISINISPKDFYLSDLYENITKLVDKYEIDPAKLKLEITESAFVLDVQEQMSLVKRLQDKGFLIEIDDFGSGYSSLNSLKDINVDILKLDMKFFEKTEDMERSEKIVESMVNLAHNLKMPVIAEGVENLEQVEMLKRVGCQVIQGFYYSRPLPLDKFEIFMETRECEDMHMFIASN